MVAGRTYPAGGSGFQPRDVARGNGAPGARATGGASVVSMCGAEPLRVEFDEVPETLLWTLYHRAAEARRPDAVIRDPLAVAVTDRIEFPFATRFGRARLGQWQALRAMTFDREVRRFLATRPGGTVVALGEGLETQFWRVDDGTVRWLTVDLPEVIDLRSRLLPPGSRMRALAGSAADPGWLDAVDATRGVLVTAQGLLMYLSPSEVHRLLERCASRLPGAAMVFDGVPRWLAERGARGSVRTSEGYRPPAWRWSIDAREERALAGLDGVATLRAVHPPRGRGTVHGLLLPAAGRVPPLRRLMLSVHRAEFAVA